MTEFRVTRARTSSPSAAATDGAGRRFAITDLLDDRPDGLGLRRAGDRARRRARWQPLDLAHLGDLGLSRHSMPTFWVRETGDAKTRRSRRPGLLGEG